MRLFLLAKKNVKTIERNNNSNRRDRAAYWRKRMRCWKCVSAPTGQHLFLLAVQSFSPFWNRVTKERLKRESILGQRGSIYLWRQSCTEPDEKATLSLSLLSHITHWRVPNTMDRAHGHIKGRVFVRTPFFVFIVQSHPLLRAGFLPFCTPTAANNNKKMKEIGRRRRRRRCVFLFLASWRIKETI